MTDELGRSPEAVPDAPTPHVHRWVRSIFDHNERPLFTMNRMMWRGYRAHVACVVCLCWTWVTREEWAKERAADAPQHVYVRHPDAGVERHPWAGRPGDEEEPQ